jgi:hypothetical protein
MVWSFVEVGVGVVAACLLALHPWVHRRTLESVVNSVRSHISLHSLEPSKMHRTPDSGPRTSKSDVRPQ